MTPEEAVRKARALLKLSSSSNANEAAAAAAKAQELMDRYKLDALAVGGEPKQRPGIVDEPVYTDTAQWKDRLLVVLAKANGCQQYFRTHTHERFVIGYPADVATIKYLYDWLEGEIEVLTIVEATGRGRSYANNFRIGCVSGIEASLADQKKATERAMRAEYGSRGDGSRLENALVLVRRDETAVQKWVETNKKLKNASYRPATLDATARKHGYEKGKDIPIGGHHKKLTSPQKGLDQ